MLQLARMFKLEAPYSPTGDQPQAIDKLSKGLLQKEKDQVLLGVTGCGKTYVVANIIQNIQKPTLVISHNKTLAAQLYQEFRDFFPKNAVEYFVSYYDYYQPESYMPATDTYIEKDADINEKIDKLRLSATTSLMTRKDVIIIASVSCIYNLGSPVVYSEMALELRTGMKLRIIDLLTRLSQINYTRSDFDFKRGTYRVTGDVIDVFPAYTDDAVRLEFFDNTLMEITFFNPLTGDTVEKDLLPEERRGGHLRAYTQDPDDYNDHRAREGDVALIYPAKHYIAAEENRAQAIEQIKTDLELRVKYLRDNGKMLEAYRIEQRTNYDLEMIQEIGYCKGIENYSRYFDGRQPGDTPYSLMDFFPKDYLVVIDESHITVPQIRGMHNGDRARKQTLIDYGFRLPSALDNRPLNFDEFLSKLNQTVYASATPDEWELTRSKDNIVELLIRPTGIVDPEILILPSKNQINDLLERIKERIGRHERVLVTTLTKRMAEELSAFLIEKQIKVTYLHSDIDTLERTNILDDLRKGNYDVLVGINLLREGLDLPEVSLVAILDADKEGFLRSDTSLIQTMGRAARHVLGQVVMYADTITGSMDRAIAEVTRRRNIQLTYNKEHNLTPIQIVKPIREKLIDQELEQELENEQTSKRKRSKLEADIDFSQLPPKELKREIKNLEKEMRYEAEMLNFESAAALRDKIRDLYKILQN
jgi:excinuclease ABC subunit B